MIDLGTVGALSVLIGVKDHTRQGIGQASSRMQTLKSVAMPLSTGLIALGAAFMLADKRAKELNETMGRVALKTEISTTTLRNMVMELGDVDFALNDVVNGMEALSRKGVRQEEDMRNLLKAYDMVADAFGLEMYGAIEKVGGALELFGFQIEDIASKQDVFAYIFQSSIGGLDEFLRSLERLGLEIEQSGMSLEQYTSLYLELEQRGLRGRAGIKALREAMAETERQMEQMAETMGLTSYEFERSEEYSTKYFDALLKNLGLTTGDLKEHAKGIEEATGATVRLDKVHEKSHSAWDKLSFAIDRARFSLGNILKPFSFLGPLLTSLGPIMMSLSMASSVWGSVNLGVVAPSLTAVTLAGLPLWLILGAIAAAVLALILVFKNWGKITGWIKRQLSKIGSFFSSLKEKIVGFASKVKEKLGGVADTIRDSLANASEAVGGWRGVLEMGLLGPLGPLRKAWDENWFGIRDTLQNVFSEGKAIVTRTMQKIREATIGNFEEIVEFLKGLPERVYNIISDAMQRIIDAIRDKYEQIKEAIGGVIDRINPLNWDIPGLSPFMEAFEHAGRLAGSAFYEGLEKQARNVSIAAPTLQVKIPTVLGGPGSGEKADNQDMIAELQQLRKTMETLGAKTITVHVDSLEVRSEQDVKKIAQELRDLLITERVSKRGS